MARSIGRAGVAGTVLLCLVGLAARPAERHQARSSADGVYTSEQAERGAKVWKHSCLRCHQPEEFKDYVRGYVGVPVSFLYDTIRAQMPQNNPGSLSRGQYADVLAYMFQINGLPPGEREMDSAPQAMDSITIELAHEDDGS